MSLEMNLAELAAWNIQLFKHNRDNITLELAETQLENKKQKKNKKNSSIASQQLGHQQLQTPTTSASTALSTTTSHSNQQTASQGTFVSSKQSDSSLASSNSDMQLQLFKARAFRTTSSEHQLLQQPACEPGASSQQASKHRCL